MNAAGIVETIKRCAVCLAALFAIVAVSNFIMTVNAITAALYMVLVVLGSAAKWGLAESIFTSVAGMLAFNFYFLPPIGTFTIADPENWVALCAFLVTAGTASKLSSNSKRRAEEALTRGNEILRLYELSRALLMEEGRDAIRQSVLRAASILRIEGVAFFDSAANRFYGKIDDAHASEAEIASVAETGEPVSRKGVAITPVRMGTHVIGSLAMAGAHLSPAIQESVAGLLAINYERALALDRAAAAEVAQRNEEFRSSLLDGLAHDLKTPLTAIRTCVTRLISIPPRTEELRQELLSIIDQESTRLQASINETIELSRIESHELHLEKVSIPLADVLERTLWDLREEDTARYRVDVEPNLTIDADPDLIRRALAQVLENARKYAPPDSPIAIEGRPAASQAASEASSEAEISVLDRGPGIDPEELARIFEKFYRGRRARGKVEGTGMGLAIAKGIIEAHGGSIRAANRPGGGAIIRIALPLAPPHGKNNE